MTKGRNSGMYGKELRTFRVLFSTVFLVLSVCYLFLGHVANRMARIPEYLQIIPSSIASCIGVTVAWLAVTLVFGRIYCSSVCPIGTLQDSATWIHRRHIAPFRYRKGAQWSRQVLFAYVVCLLLGILGVATLIEPWNMMRSAARISNHAGAEQWTWLLFSKSAGLGAAVGIAVLVAVWVWALLCGRRFCNEVCPIGTVLGYASRRSLMHIEIDPDKCTGCLKCEDVCKAECIKVVSRYVDNSRCVRCFDCLNVCEENAIRYQPDRNRRATPLFRKRART